jgi:trk system potassium uptake protein TrkA
VVVIEQSEDRVRQLREAADIHVVHGSGSNPRVLAEAGLEDAEMLIAVTDSDELNLVACLAASAQTIVEVKIARVRDPDLAEAVPAMFPDQPLGLTINPEEEAANALLKTLQVPGAVGVFPFADGRVQLVAFHVDRECEAVGLELHDLKPKLDIDFNLVAISRDGALLIPDGRSDIRVRDRVYVAGTPDALEQFAAVLKKQQRQTRHIVISGGGGISYYLARGLEEQDVAPKIIEPDTNRCKFLVERLKRTVVLQGVGTDPELLREENIETTDVFLALTRDEEDNILSALLAKRSGASEVMALVNKPSYSSLASAMGIDAIVSPNQVAVSAILQFIRKGKVVSVTTVGEESAEALEVVALETSELVGRPLREVAFQGAVIGAIVRGDDVIIPTGDDVIEVGDHVVIFATRSAIPNLERQMTVQLRYF